MDNAKILNCLVIDDEPPARDIIRRYIEKLPVLRLAGECDNALESISFLQRNKIDLIFLDIRMPQMNGNEFLKIIKNLPPVIFTTAHIEYAIEGYDLDVVDYLLKPVKFERFVKAVNKAFMANGYNLVDVKPAIETGNGENFVYFRAERKMIKVMLNNIFYIEGMKDYIKVCTTEGTIITKQSLNSVESMLPAKEFIRTHRSFIISLSKVKSYTHEIMEINKNEIPIGKFYRNDVLEILKCGYALSKPV